MKCSRAIRFVVGLSGMLCLLAFSSRASGAQDTWTYQKHSGDMPGVRTSAVLPDPRLNMKDSRRLK